MPQEIERKYLIRRDAWTPKTPGVLYRQGYLVPGKECEVRVRIAGEEAYLTVKGPARGLARLEFEYVIPFLDAQTMLDLLCEQPIIEKTSIGSLSAGRYGKSMSFTGPIAALPSLR
jgi:adenylate cyclase